ncbi:hypothetical protein GBA52_026687 [Prunus armeniaca]|nr:hypothetical protein GBA52_026687 [Prunus armeniaca]
MWRSPGSCSRCVTHGSTRIRRRRTSAGNSEAQCPGLCAWPFLTSPSHGPQTPPLVEPNGDVGIDGVIINLATLLAGTVTNPYNNGYFQGPASAPLEAVSGVHGRFWIWGLPGLSGSGPVDKSTGASYNARKKPTGASSAARHVGTRRPLHASRLCE